MAEGYSGSVVDHQSTGITNHNEQPMYGTRKVVDHISWELNKCQIVVTKENIVDVQAAVKVEMFETKRKAEIKFVKEGNSLTAQFPIPPYEGNSTALGFSLYNLYKADTCKAKPDFAFDLEKLKSWPEEEFVKAVLRSACDRRDNIKCILCIPVIPRREKIIRILETKLTKENGKTEYAQAPPQRRITISVESGSLEKAKADILVCTMPSNLDLCDAASSGALLQAAGDSLQVELDDKYYDKLELGEIAQVHGHKLRCKHVLLGVMERYRKEYDYQNEGADKFYARNVYNFMMNCLEKAEILGAVSIAFPAIGSGNLYYPLEIVAEEMFKSVHLYQDLNPHTVIQHVKFVIFHQDDEALEVFQDIEKKIINKYTSKRLTGNQNLQEHSPHRNAEAAGCTDNPSKVTSVKSSSRRDKGSSTVWVTDHGATGIEKTQPRQERDDVEELCDLLNKQNLDDSDKDTNSINSPKNQRTMQNQDTSPIQQNIFELEDPLTVNVARFFFSDLIQKYERKGVKFVFENKSVIVQDLDNMFIAFETEFTSAVNKLKNNIIEESIDVTNNFEQEIDTDLLMKYEKQGVLLKFNRDTKQVKFYGTNWKDVQAVKQTVKLKLFQNCKTNERNKDFRTPQNPSADFKKQTNMSQHYLNGGHDQGAKPKHKNTNIPSNKVTNSNQQPLKKKYKIKTVDVKVYSSDIRHIPVGCIVNAANCNLQHKGGVAYVIAEAAGKAFRDESERYVKTHGKLKVGEACRTSAGNLEYHHVIHTVGPCWSHYKPHHLADVRRCEDDLMNAIKNSLHCAESVCKTVAFTAISAGQFACPLELCAVQYGKAVLEYIASSNHQVKEIHFVDLNPDIVYQIKNVFSTIESTDNIPENYDSKMFVNQKPKTGKTPHDNEGSKAPRRPPLKHEKQDVPTSTVASHQYPHCLPATGLPTTNDIFTCICSETKKLLVYAADIFTMENADMIVCGENISGKGKGFLSNTLSDIGGKNYQLAKERAFKSATHGDVIVCKGGSNHYKIIAHVVLPKRAEIDDEQKLTATFNKLFSHVKEKNCHSVALPLLGTGKGKVDTSYCAQMLFRSMMNFCKNHPKYPVQVHLINIEPDKTNIIISTIQQCVGSMVDHHKTPPKRPPQPSTRQPERHTQSDSTPEEISKSQTKKKTSIGKKFKESSTISKEASGSDQSFSRENNQDKPQTNRISARGVCGETSDDDADDDDFGFKTKKTYSVNDIESSQRTALEDKKKGKKQGNIPIIDDTPSPSDSVNMKEKDSNSLVLEDMENSEESKQEEDTREDCVICMDEIKDPKVLPCGHKFCADCIDAQFRYKEVCPTCGAVCGVITGDQPEGTMDVYTNKYEVCSGYEGSGRIEITYRMPNGQQKSYHPSPGMHYRGITRKAYLPDNRKGRKILAMLRIAFDRRLIFTIGSSRTSGLQGVITWNDIHHKTDPKPHGPFGYPDPTYLERVVDELKAKGITEADIQPSENVLSTRL